VQGLLNGVRRRHVVVEEGVAHIVLKQGPQARSTARNRKMHDIANKFVDGRHGTFFSSELAGELACELLLASFLSSQWLERADDVLNVKWNSKCKSEK
jgi:hypothetical protein